MLNSLIIETKTIQNYGNAMQQETNTSKYQTPK